MEHKGDGVSKEIERGGARRRYEQGGGARDRWSEEIDGARRWSEVEQVRWGVQE